MIIAVGTTSSLKLRAVQNAFIRAGITVEVTGYKVRSGVPKQPFSEKEITTGATNRAKNAIEKDVNAYCGIGIESGIAIKGTKYFALAACTIVNKVGAVIGESFSAAVETPEKVINFIKSKDSESGVAAQKFGGITEKDPLLWYTGNRMTREKILEDAVFLALCKEFLNPEAYK